MHGTGRSRASPRTSLDTAWQVSSPLPRAPPGARAASGSPPHTQSDCFCTSWKNGDMTRGRVICYRALRSVRATHRRLQAQREQVEARVCVEDDEAGEELPKAREAGRAAVLAMRRTVEEEVPAARGTACLLLPPRYTRHSSPPHGHAL